MNNFEAPLCAVLGNFSPRLRENIKEILTDVNFGLSSLNLKINSNLNKTFYKDYVETYMDSFVVEIPYAGRKLEWEVIFKDEDYSYAPDFEFVNDLFLFDPDVNVISDHIPSLANWNVEDCKSLKHVITELLCLYKSLQVMKLQTENRYSRLYGEYKSLIEAGVSETNVEIFVDDGGIVQFLIGIMVDFSCLPPYIQPGLNEDSEILNPHVDLATLKISFSKPDCTKVQSNLYLTPRLDQTIGNSTNLCIPSYNKDATLPSYVSDVTKLLKDQVERVANHHKLKNEYITTLVTQCGSNIIEYDNMLFTKVTLLFSINNIYAIVHISLSNKFPQDKPKVMLRSIYNLQNDKPFHRILEDYPYYYEWKCDRMIKRLLHFLQEQIPKFQATAQHNFSI
ncbi:hypothetical protein FQA39_LY15062 [Lamprigera yunnana]|nr:hypothetical protein FQA39_LY15062 [Lamprigera yunnana]